MKLWLCTAEQQSALSFWLGQKFLSVQFLVWILWLHAHASNLQIKTCYLIVMFLEGIEVQKDAVVNTEKNVVLIIVYKAY